MPASTSDKFKKASISTVTTLAAPGKALAASSITVGSTTNFNTTTGIIIAIRVVDSAGELVAGTYTEWSATVSSGTTLALVTTPVYGTDQVYPAGSTTQVYVPLSSSAYNALVDGILVQHGQDGTHGAVTATSVSAPTLAGTASISEAGTTLATMRTETMFDHVASGCVWTGDSYGSTRFASMTAGVAYINGQRLVIAAITAHPFTASCDTYVDISNTAGVGTVVYGVVSNNAVSPVVQSYQIRIGIIATGATNILNAGSVNQGEESKVLPIASSIAYSVTDSLGNLICPRDPNRRTLGYRESSTVQTGISTSAVILTGMSSSINAPSGRKVKIEVIVARISSSSAAVFTLYIYNSATVTGSPIATVKVLQSLASVIISGYIFTEHTSTGGVQSYCAAISTDTGTATTTGLSAIEANRLKIDLT